MKYKTLFRVMLKLLGVYFGGMGVMMLVGRGLDLLSTTLYRSGVPTPAQYCYYAISMVAALVQAGLGLYLFFGGKWIVNMAIPGNRPYCHECGYDLTGAVGNVCNECGTAFRASKVAATISHE